MSHLSILYVMASLPGFNAPTKHAFSIAEMMRDVDCNVEILSTAIHRRGEEWKTAAESCSCGLTVPKSLGYFRWQLIGKRLERSHSIFARKAFREAYARTKPDLVVYYGIRAKLAEEVHTLCKRDAVGVVVDETDWFRDSDTSFERDRNNRFENLDPKSDGIIAISPFLFEHFSMLAGNSGLPRVFFMPPLNPKGEKVHRSSSVGRLQEGTTRFLYAGSIGGEKDHIKEFIQVLMSCGGNCATRPFLDVIGVDERQAVKALGFLPPVSLVKFHGRRPHECVMKMLETADFGVLLRKPETYAKAGFSTKFAECMSAGVPMLCNEVGGADSVLLDGVDGIVVPDLTLPSVATGLEMACDMSDEDLRRMKGAALEKAQRLFEQDTYKDGFAAFLRDVRLTALKKRVGAKDR